MPHDRMWEERRMMEEEVPVILTITGRQTDPEEDPPQTRESTAVYEAVCMARDGEYRFRYLAEGEEACLLLSKTCARMERGDARGTRMLFDPAVPSTKCAYRTPYGTIPMEIRTERITLMDGGFPAGARVRARIKYTLSMEPGIRLECRVTIRSGQHG
ncbi:MAG: DUF1934 domain-containing protein [Eubacteriales bacterium]|nr:DUF1934 domain-containing protein [Eubacteriales bacterium]